MRLIAAGATVGFLVALTSIGSGSLLMVFLLLLVPLALLAVQERGGVRRMLLATAYFLPFLALAVPGKQGNFLFPLSAIILFIMLYRDTRQLDGSLRAA